MAGNKPLVVNEESWLSEFSGEMQDWVRTYYDSAVVAEGGRLRHEPRYKSLDVEELLAVAFARVHATELDEIAASRSAPLEFARMTFLFDEPDEATETAGG